MSDLDPTSILRERYETLAARRVELRDELDPLELEMARLQAGLKAMGALDIPKMQASAPEIAALRLVPADVTVPMVASAPRVRHPDLQQAIDNQTPSVAIPRGTKLYCSQGCVNGEAVGFGDHMAMRTHTKREHDREPTEAEKVPR